MATQEATPKRSPYNKKKVVKNGAGNKAIETVRNKYARHKDKPTMAAADPSKKIPEALMQVDPKMLSVVLPQMYTKLMQVRNLMNSFNSQNSSGAAPAGYSRRIIINVFKGALAILCKEHGDTKVLTVLFDALSGGRYEVLGEDYIEIVLEAIIKLIQDIAQYGSADIPVSTIPAVTIGSGVPTPLYNSLDDVPDYYAQQYYTTDLDPYPGYMEFYNTLDTTTVLYVSRRTTDYPFESAEEEVHTLAEYGLAAALSPYFRESNLTVGILSILLIRYCEEIMNDTAEKTAGKNSQANLLSMLTQFAGLAGAVGNLAKTGHLPPSVLDVASMGTTVDNHIKNIGKIKMMKALSSKAFDPTKLLNISGIGSSITNKLNSSSVNIADIQTLVTNGLKT